jgi:serine/threonine-protein kinase RsbW
MHQKFGRSVDQLKDIVASTEQFFAARGIDESLRYVVDLCVEELFVNMVTYDTETDADILIEMAPHEDGVEVRMTDYDVKRFDPRDAASVDVEAPLEQRTPGGLGLFLLLKMVSAINYEYRDGSSTITFIVTRK